MVRYRSWLWSYCSTWRNVKAWRKRYSNKIAFSVQYSVTEFSIDVFGMESVVRYNPSDVLLQPNTLNATELFSCYRIISCHGLLSMLPKLSLHRIILCLPNYFSCFGILPMPPNNFHYTECRPECLPWNRILPILPNHFNATEYIPCNPKL